MVESKRQYLLFYFQRMFAECIFLGPIISLFYLSRGLSYFEIMLLQVGFTMSLTLFQVPTGIIADKYGRKFSLILGSVLLCLSLAVIIPEGSSFGIYAFSELLFGAGLAFRSGSDTALIYSYLKNAKKENEYPILEGNANSFMAIASAVGCVLSGYLYEFYNILPLILSCIWALLGILPVLGLKEYKSSVKEEKLGFIDTFKKGHKNVFSQQRLKTMLVFSCSFMAFFSVSFWFYTPTLISIDFRPSYFGWVFLGLNLTYALASKFGTKFAKATKGYSLIAVFTILAMGILMCGLTRNIFCLIFFLPDQVVRGLYPVVYNKYINKYINEGIRATVLSYLSTYQLIIASISKLLFGYVMDKFNIFDIRVVVGVVMVFLGVFLYWYLKSNIRNISISNRAVCSGEADNIPA